MALTEQLSTLKTHSGIPFDAFPDNQAESILEYKGLDHDNEVCPLDIADNSNTIARDVRIEEGLIIRQVLNRAVNNQEFWLELMEDSSAALAHFELSADARAAIAFGDVRWISGNVADITESEMAFLYKRLEVQVC